MRRKGMKAVAVALVAAWPLWLAVHEIGLSAVAGPTSSTPAALASTPAYASVDTRPERRAADSDSDSDDASADGLPLAEQAALDAAVRRHFEALARGGDARQKLIALRFLLAGSADPVARRNAQAEASRLLLQSPDDELVALAQTWFCDPRPRACDPASTEAWAKIAPGNAAAWLQPLDSAANEPDRADALLARASRASRWDAQTHMLALETIAAYDDLRLPPIGPGERRLLTSVGFGLTDAERRRFLAASAVFALPLPPLGAITRFCRPTVAASRAASCRTVYVRLATATTLIERMVATAGLARLARTPAEATYWTQRHAELQEMSRRFQELATDARYWNDFVRFGEVEAMHRALQRAGTAAPPVSR